MELYISIFISEFKLVFTIATKNGKWTPYDFTGIKFAIGVRAYK